MVQCLWFDLTVMHDGDENGYSGDGGDEKDGHDGDNGDFGAN